MAAQKVEVGARLIEDVQSMLAWRGVLSIVAEYQKAGTPHEKACHAIDALVFILDRVEGEGACPRLRALLALAKSDLSTSPFAKEIARLIAQASS